MFGTTAEARAFIAQRDEDLAEYFTALDSGDRRRRVSAFIALNHKPARSLDMALVAEAALVDIQTIRGVVAEGRYRYDRALIREVNDAAREVLRTSSLGGELDTSGLNKRREKYETIDVLYQFFERTYGERQQQRIDDHTKRRLTTPAQRRQRFYNDVARLAEEAPDALDEIQAVLEGLAYERPEASA